MGIAAWFKKVQAGHEKTRRYKVCVEGCLSAILAGDPVALKAALGTIQTHPAGFGGHLDGRAAGDGIHLSEVDSGRLLKAAIDQGDVKVFRAVVMPLGAPRNDENARETGAGFAGYSR